MKPSRIAFYAVIAIIATMIAYLVLAKEPPPGWPINLIHLLAKH